MLSDGRHLVLGDEGGSHSLWLRETDRGKPLAYVVPRDDGIELRSRATQRLEQRLSGVPPDRCPGQFRPTHFQARRLTLLLRILDMLHAERQSRPSTHEIARQLVYPRLAIGRGAEWKASPERRRTQRLIEEARSFMNGRYRSLLKGKLAGATKTSGPK